MNHKDKLIVAGDFNAPHSHWGYVWDCAKGTRLVQVADKFDLKLETRPLAPTRLGDSVSLDTYPDLTFTKKLRGSVSRQWRLYCQSINLVTKNP
ncbi:hypothetical protein HPB49_010607 [Dermacentor silvarum]|uniref:Uncharacterized protein n=1 Tax=Dermacentor silvarum TaxID=543639 RepID=A0ACB8DCK2_DERSI|nr:hypothetical protein HPB49_010607 [Dermacentor silvarum]